MSQVECTSSGHGNAELLPAKKEVVKRTVAMHVGYVGSGFKGVCSGLALWIQRMGSSATWWCTKATAALRAQAVP
jgi:hypothetical protein